MDKIHEVKAVGCPDEATLIAYISGKLIRAQASAVEEHIADCHLCLENIRAGYMGDKLYRENRLTDTSDKSRRKAKGIAKMKSNRVIQRNLWLAATIAAFSLSFAAPKYFVQFLVAALILGLKWVSESESVRTLIVSMDAKRSQTRDKDARMSKKINNRF